MNTRKVILTALAGAYVTLWVGGVSAHVLQGGPPTDAQWAAPVFLFLAGLIVLVTASSANLGGLLAAAGIGFIAEYLASVTAFSLAGMFTPGRSSPSCLARRW